MLVTVIAAWMVASQRKFKRNWGFGLFLLSNVLWITWGLKDRAYALIILQVCLGQRSSEEPLAVTKIPDETKVDSEPVYDAIKSALNTVATRPVN
jgi:hypothetical protein